MGVGWKTGRLLATNPNALVSKAQFLVTLVTHWYAISQHELIQFFLSVDTSAEKAIELDRSLLGLEQGVDIAMQVCCCSI